METNNSRQAAWVAIGSFCSFLVGIISTMILSRFFNKADYGTYKQVMYVYSTLLGVFTLGIPRAYSYFIPKVSASEVCSLINRITSIFVILGFIFSLFLFLFSNIIADLLANPDLGQALRVFSPTPLFLLPTMGLEGIYASFRKTMYSSLYAIVTRIIVVICTVFPVIFWNGGYIAAIIGFDIASFFSCILALFLKTWPVRRNEKIKTMVSYKDIFLFSIPLLYASLWGIILSSANQFFISRYFGNETFAEFSNGYMEIPVVGMVISAIATVLLPIFSGRNSTDKMDEGSVLIWRAALVKSAKIIFPILIFSCVFSKPIMTCLYGDSYGVSYIYFVIKNFGGLFFIIPFAPVIISIGKTKAYANAHMVAAIAIVIMEFLCVKFFPSPVTIALISEACQLLKIYLLMRVIIVFSGLKWKEFFPLKELTKIVIISFLSSILAKLGMSFIDNKFLLLFIGGVIYLVLFYGLCFLFRLSYRSVIESFVGDTKLKGILRLMP